MTEEKEKDIPEELQRLLDESDAYLNRDKVSFIPDTEETKRMNWLKRDYYRLRLRLSRFYASVYAIVVRWATRLAVKNLDKAKEFMRKLREE